MTDYPADVVADACELLNEEYSGVFKPEEDAGHVAVRAVCRALMKTAAFRREVSDVAKRAVKAIRMERGEDYQNATCAILSRFIVPESREFLVEALGALESTFRRWLDGPAEQQRYPSGPGPFSKSDLKHYADCLATAAERIAAVAPAPLSEERIMEMAREVHEAWTWGNPPLTENLALAGIKRGLAERGELK